MQGRDVLLGNVNQLKDRLNNFLAQEYKGASPNFKYNYDKVRDSLLRCVHEISTQIKEAPQLLQQHADYYSNFITQIDNVLDSIQSQDRDRIRAAKEDFKSYVTNNMPADLPYTISHRINQAMCLLISFLSGVVASLITCGTATLFAGAVGLFAGAFFFKVGPRVYLDNDVDKTCINIDIMRNRM